MDEPGDRYRRESGARVDRVGCWVCAHLENDEFAAMTQLQAALARDTECRGAVAVEGGLCNHHMWYMGRLATDTTTVALVRAVVARVHADLQGTPPPSMIQAALSRLGRDCRVCASLWEREAAYIGATVERVRADNAEAGQSALCLPHLMALLSAFDDARDSSLEATWCRRIEEIAMLLTTAPDAADTRLRGTTAVLLSHGFPGLRVPFGPS